MADGDEEESAPAGSAKAVIEEETKHTKLAAEWEQLMVKLVALRGDPDTEAFLTEKHQELSLCAVPLDPKTGKPQSAADGTTADEAQSSWFQRKLKREAKSISERRKKVKEVIKALDKFSKQYEEPGKGAVSATEALKDGSAQEGPIICAGLASGLAGTRFEGLRIARERPGMYQLGDKPIRVAVQALEEKLLIHGYFDGKDLHPVRVDVKAFLEEHGAVAAEDEDCDLFGGGGASAKRGSDEGVDAEAKKPRELPPGWVKAESRSKPGVFYYKNEAKGLSQMERPTA